MCPDHGPPSSDIVENQADGEQCLRPVERLQRMVPDGFSKVTVTPTAPRYHVRTEAFARSGYRAIGIDGIPCLMPGPIIPCMRNVIQPCASSPRGAAGDIRCSLGTRESR